MTAERRQSIIVAALACAAFASFYTALGLTVSHRPPAGIDVAARGVTGEAPAVAWMLTESCLWPVLSVFGIAGCVLAACVPAWRARVCFAIVTTLVTWQLSDVLKAVFRRPRPDYWIVYHEPSFAYSSGHAMFAVVVYWLWAFFVLRSELAPVVRFSLGAALIVWGAGVIWSRLALGAHYPTDLAGGILLAATMLAAAACVARILAPEARIA